MQNTALSNGDIILGFTTACTEHPHGKRPQLLAAIEKEHSRDRATRVSLCTQRDSSETETFFFFLANIYKRIEDMKILELILLR